MPACFVMFGWLLFLGSAPPASAQAAAMVKEATAESGGSGQASTADSSEAASILEQAKASGATIIVIEPGMQPKAVDAGPDMAEQITALMNALRASTLELAADAPSFPEQYQAALKRYGGLESLGYALVLLLAALVVGYGAEALIDRWARPQMALLFRGTPESRAEKIAFLLTRAIVRILRVLVQAAVAAAVVFAVDPDNEAIKSIALLALAMFAIAGCGEAVFRNITAADAPEHRLLALDQDQAWGLYRDLRNVLFFVLVVAFLAKSTEILGMPHLGALLARSVSALVAGIASIWFTLRQRRTVERIILGHRPGRASPPRRVLAHLWYVPVLLYFLIAWATTGVELLLGIEAPLQLVGLPVVVALGAIAAYGVMLMLADIVFKRRMPAPAASAAAMPPDGGPTEQAPAMPVAGEAGAEEPLPAEPVPAEAAPEDAEAAAAAPPPVDRSYAGLAERAVGWIAVLGAAAVMMDVWGLDSAVFGGFWGAFWEIVLVAFVAWLAYEAVRIAVDRRIAEEGVSNGAAGSPMDEEGPRRGLSRLGTLLPMFRTFLLLSILVFAGMIILSAMGVDVTPLFAGAGVIGLAIGFGAQTLIRDIFSGAFFLIDDAFRLGEYVNVGPVKGTVERVSIRSMQLRHQLGPLHTIPFGEITHLQNYSRDWVMMKLPLRVTYDTDVEKVRKLIKNLGQELQEDPLIGHLFLQPLKSQGVYQMEDSAMIIRVKFMTRPGDQFMVRKAVYSRIRELFAENGIRFAHREVTVRVAEGHGDGAEPDPRRAGAAAGAALSAIAASEQAAGGQPAGGDGR
ncbi:mechanosensitive ion channel family protein [Marinibaculum pumilum]|uniref:Mechanosensitive ion channel family protein n=1 Tax=Marinibaculum pumilum TaxID=1766165 RepID=A0ABV7L2Q1_9PROT